MKASDEVITRLINHVVESSSLQTLCNLHAVLCVDDTAELLREAAYKAVMERTFDSCE